MLGRIGQGLEGVEAATEDQRQRLRRLQDSVRQATGSIRELQSTQASAAAPSEQSVAALEAKLDAILGNLCVNLSIEQSLFSGCSGPIVVGGSISMSAGVDADAIVQQIRQQLAGRGR